MDLINRVAVSQPPAVIIDRAITLAWARFVARMAMQDNDLASAQATAARSLWPGSLTILRSLGLPAHERWKGQAS